MAETQAELARRQVEVARLELERTQRARCFWDDLLGSLRRGHAAHALLLMRREEELIQQFEGRNDDAVERLRGLQREVQESARASVGGIARVFPVAAREAGIQIDSRSRHPSYSFNEGFLRVELDERTFTANIAPRDGDDVMVGLDIDLVIETIRGEQKRLFGREVDVKAFLRSLHTAYAAVLRAEGRMDGDDMPLRRVTNRLAKNLNRFAADEFNVDLSRLVQGGDLVIEGKRVRLNHTRDQRQGMLLHGLESGGYIGFISFKPEKDG